MGRQVDRLREGCRGEYADELEGKTVEKGGPAGRVGGRANEQSG